MTDPLVEAFLGYLSAERALSLNTLASYRSDLAALATFLNVRGTSFKSAAPADCEAWIGSLRKQGLSPASITRKTSVLRTFARFAFQSGLFSTDLSCTVDEPPRQALRLPKTLTNAEIDILLSDAWDNYPEAARDHAMLELMYGSGLRVSELVTMRTDQVDLISLIVRPIGKGNKERLVPLSNKAANWLSAYMASKRTAVGAKRFAPADHLFTTRLGEPMTRQNFWNIIRTRARIAGIKRNVTPHMLRHSFATHLLARGADVRVIQEMLGHASVATTQRYTKVDVERMRASYTKAHPRSE